MVSLFAQANLSDESIGAFAVITFVFIGLIALVASRALSERYEIKFIVLGLFTAVAAIGYGAMVTGETIAAGSGAAAMLMRLAVILVLTGVATSLLPRVNGTSTSSDA